MPPAPARAAGGGLPGHANGAWRLHGYRAEPRRVAAAGPPRRRDRRCRTRRRSGWRSSRGPSRTRVSVGTGHTSRRSCASRWCSCSERTCGSCAARSAIPAAAATAAATVVMHATRWRVAARRMCIAVGAGPAALRGVDDEVDLAGRDEIDGVDRRSCSPTFATTVSTGSPRPRACRRCRPSPRGAKPSSTKRRAAASPRSLSRSASEKNTVPLAGSAVPGCGLALGERQAERAVDAHHLAGGAHLGAEDGVDARGTGRTAAPPPSPRRGRARRTGGSSPSARSSSSVAPTDDARRELGERDAGRLADERDGAARTRVRLDDEHRRRPSPRTAR